MKFRPGDKVRCIEGWELFNLMKGEIYTVSFYNSNVLEIALKELPNHGFWKEERFELVVSCTAQQSVNNGLNNWITTNPNALSPRLGWGGQNLLTQPLMSTIKDPDIPYVGPELLRIDTRTGICECGSASIGVDKHSSYCPRYDK